MHNVPKHSVFDRTNLSHVSSGERVNQGKILSNLVFGKPSPGLCFFNAHYIVLSVIVIACFADYKNIIQICCQSELSTGRKKG